MIMAGMEFMKDIPFKDVYIHGTVRDIEGKKMSKSLGNIIDPLEIIGEYGSDALRFSLISITAQGQDVFLSKEKFEQGRNFANKIWNASRFILMNLEPSNVSEDLCEFFKKEGPDIVNCWILSRFYSVLKKVNHNLESYKFNEAANLLYGFFWHEFCDWYLEIIKPDIKDRANQMVMYKVLEKFLRVMHPFMPFVTEEIWQMLRKLTGAEAQSIMIQPWPHLQEQMINKKLEKEAESIFNIVSQIRNLRSWVEIKPDQNVRVSVYPHSKAQQKSMQENNALIANLARLQDLVFLVRNEKPKDTISSVVEDADIYMHFEGLFDVARQQQKIKERIEDLERIIRSKKMTLDNPDFLKRAPQEVVEKEKESEIKLEGELERLRKMYEELR